MSYGWVPKKILFLLLFPFAVSRFSPKGLHNEYAIVLQIIGRLCYLIEKLKIKQILQPPIVASVSLIIFKICDGLVVTLLESYCY